MLSSVRKALFDILGDRIPGANVLDIFAGTGSLGIESLSRGANSAVFIEKSRNVSEALFHNISECGLADRSRIITDDWRNGLRRTAESGMKFEVIYIDPPFEMDLYRVVIDEIKRLSLLHEAGVAVVKHPSNVSGSDLGSSLEAYDTRKYGSTRITFLREVK